jgi:hypothetical protein
MGKPAYSRDSLKNGLQRLVERLVFQYKDFSLTPSETASIDNTIAGLTKNEQLTIGKWRKSQWVGFLLLRLIVSSYISDAIVNGVFSWDIRITLWLSIVLQASADCRAGEVARSCLCTGKEYLSCGDIDIQLVDGDEFQNLQAKVVLRYEKGSKYVPFTSLLPGPSFSLAL